MIGPNVIHAYDMKANLLHKLPSFFFAEPNLHGWAKRHLLLFPVKIHHFARNLEHSSCVLQNFHGIVKVVEHHAEEGNINAAAAAYHVFSLAHKSVQILKATLRRPDF